MISFNDNYKKILLCVSGGADSALGLYLTCEYITSKKIDTDLYVFSGTEGKNNVATFRVVDYVTQKFPNVISEHIVESMSESLSKGYKKQDVFARVVRSDNYDLHIRFPTLNPPHFIDNRIEMRSRELYKNCNSSGWPYWSKFEGVTFYRPFLKIDKKAVVNLYKDRDIFDELFPLTYSCIGKDMYPDVCGSCFWCKEREWATS